ncbi:nucleoside-diphosphate-sugar epimerase [Lewinella marina]|uniref:Epimerase n=1 Tax=Neolewinella marina TaxID=438751 RepID=A0A2G0CII3_9BACT|nr:NAD-dependent epimerase/dehydratase family protein [Neolewinella marina]NJB85080.1 nucleoside-diphosphate-sugar epimerase [Neolewinella marina]PHK99779.1 epimerase [Neolewinella marina]
MNFHLVSGGCGFVGRNMVKRLYRTTQDKIIFVDNLSVGTHPSTWLDAERVRQEGDLEVYGTDERLLFLHQDFRQFLRDIIDDEDFIRNHYAPDFERFSDVFHFAAIVGGRSTIEGDPMKVALDLSIDAEFFYWVTRHRPDRTLYPSSSAAYPIDLQTEGDAIALAESDINFKKMGEPDMTYGWSKLTGEFLARTAAEHYNLSVTCIRPFSGYGEDQDLSYPIPAIAARIARREDPVEVWGTGRQGRDFVHIDDVLDCIFFAMERVTDGSAINIGRGELLSFIDIIHTMCGIEGYQPEIKQLLDKPVGVFSRYSNMDHVHAMGWKARISVREGMRRVLEAQKGV